MQLEILEKGQTACTLEITGPVELGRQMTGEGEPYTQTAAGDGLRLVIAPREELSISRRYALFEPVPPNSVRVTNLSTSQPLTLPDGIALPPGQARELGLPLWLSAAGRSLRFSVMHSLAEATLAPGQRWRGLEPIPAGSGVGLPTLVRWFQHTMSVLQAAATDPEFFQAAAEALVAVVGLDSGRVLLWTGDGWRSQAVDRASGPVADLREPSRSVLDRVRREKRTFWQLPEQMIAATESLQDVRAVIAAPVLDRRGEVIGALYGDRLRHSRPGPELSEIDALLVELLACGVAAGLARIEQERAALSARTLFAQFFTPELTRRLELEPDLLSGRQRNVTVLFCDIRGFSRISERLGPARTMEWTGAVMGELSDCILAHHGVLVDYIGDELLAMWGAPDDQPDQAFLACQAGLEMLGRLPDLNARWQQMLGEPVRLGIGINSGPAFVGNTGSQRKFKYGALGNTVNLASRVQGATKHLKCPLLITAAVREQCGPRLPLRRIGKVQTVNIQEPVDLYEVATAGGADWDSLRQGYEAALDAFEARDFRRTVQILGELLIGPHGGDGPALILLSRASHLLSESDDEPVSFNPVWTLPGK